MVAISFDKWEYGRTGFYDTGKTTLSTIEVNPGTYDVMFKLSGYTDKIISKVNVSEGATESVSVTLEREGAPAPPTEKAVTFVSVPLGASVEVARK